MKKETKEAKKTTSMATSLGIIFSANSLENICEYVWNKHEWWK